MKCLKQKGFTLIELLIVVSIIGVLATVILSSLSEARSRAKNSAIKSNINQLRTALELYYLDNNNYPTQINRCIGYAEGESCWDGLSSGGDALNNALAPYIDIESLRGTGYRSGDIVFSGSSTSLTGCNNDRVSGNFIFWAPSNFEAGNRDCEGLGVYSCCAAGSPFCAATAGSYCAIKID